MFWITDLGFGRQDEEFETEEEAIEWAFDMLPTDDTAYGILDDDINDYVCVVFQAKEWRPS